MVPARVDVQCVKSSTLQIQPPSDDLQLHSTIVVYNTLNSIHPGGKSYYTRNKRLNMNSTPLIFDRDGFLPIVRLSSPDAFIASRTFGRHSLSHLQLVARVVASCFLLH